MHQAPPRVWPQRRSRSTRRRSRAHFFLGKLLFKEEKFAESARELEISEINPSGSAVRFALIRAYNALGKKTEAKREADAFKRLSEFEDRFRQSGQVPPSTFSTEPRP